MPKILILVAVDLIDKAGNTIAAKAHEIHDVDTRQTKALIRTGQADDNPLALAWHSGDMTTYQRLLAEIEEATEPSGGASPSPAPGVAPVSPTSTPTPPASTAATTQPTASVATAASASASAPSSAPAA